MNLLTIITIIAVVIFILILAISLSRSPRKEINAESINQRNEMAVAMKAFTTGKTCIGEVDKDGELKITVLEDE